MTFLLNILKELKARTGRQFQNMAEEMEHLRLHLPALRHKALFQNPMTIFEYRRNKDRLQQLEYEWINNQHEQATVLKGLILRFRKLLQHKRGRISMASLLAQDYLSTGSKKS